MWRFIFQLIGELKEVYLALLNVHFNIIFVGLMMFASFINCILKILHDLLSTVLRMYCVQEKSSIFLTVLQIT